MSANASPSHYANEYSSYDPFYTADISNRMRVPDRILVPGASRQNPIAENPNNKINMNVPDRIILAGGNQHISAPAPPRELQLESSIIKSAPDPVGLNTPPRTLTLEDHSFPSIDEMTNRREENSSGAILNGYMSSENRLQIVDSDEMIAAEHGTSEDVNMVSNALGGGDNLQFLRRKVSHFERRLQVLELENQQTQHREMVIYSAGFVYMVLKGLLWLHRHW